jgi:hypothetical protein
MNMKGLGSSPRSQAASELGVMRKNLAGKVGLP